tara:strand:+ start:896 stop:1561 length:666 start_codon:yes stop_codon:yes gene_type:complete
MELLIHRLLEKDEAEKLEAELTKNNGSWEDGKKSAGSYAAKVKNNLQLDQESTKSRYLSEEIINHIENEPLIKSFALPRKMHGLRFSKTIAGQGYGNHVDNTYMSSGRSDLSFTLFLSNPKSYKGGELCIHSLQGSQQIKLDAGEIVIYPSTSLHSVEKVTSGTRLVCVGWIQSYISSDEERNLLFGLEAGAKGLLAKYGQSDELNLIFQTYNNLLRRLGD